MALLPTPLSDELVDSLRAAIQVRDERLSVSQVDRIAYARDVSPVVMQKAFQGDFPHAPGVVFWPESTAEIASLLTWASANGVSVTPYGGGSGIVGAALAINNGIVVDMRRMDRILEIDQVSMTARVQTGINGQRLEDTLNQRGWTLGHLPQSIPSSTLGGWIAHRAAGTASTRYGKMEDLVEALEVVLPTGERLTTRSVPRSSTGPDLNHLFLGAEGVFGIVTEATVSIRPKPQVRGWDSYVYSSMEEGVEAIRSLIQADYRPAFVRLYDAEEAIPLLQDVPGIAEGSVLLILGCEGSEPHVAFQQRGVHAHCAPLASAELGDGPAVTWWNHRLSTAGLVRTIASEGWIADALEITAPWSRLTDIYHSMRTAMLAEVGEEGRVYGHVSHVYHTGGNLYMIFHARSQEGEDEQYCYARVLDAAFSNCIALGGSLSHHHGVGSTKAPWLPSEHGDTGLAAIHRIQRVIDPAGIMNPVVGLHGRSICEN